MPLLAAGLLAVAQTGAGRAEKKDVGPLERKALDTTVYKTLREIANQGADLYNGGDYAGCYRLYEGALLTLQPLLDHRPELQRVISSGVLEARAKSVVHERAFALREVIDKVRRTVKPAAVAGPSGTKPSPVKDSEPKKPEPKKPEPKKSEEKKPEPKKPDEKKPEPKKTEPKKSEEKKPVEKKVEPKADDKKPAEKKSQEKKSEEKKSEEKKSDKGTK